MPEHFKLETLSPGVYAAIAVEGSLAYSNAGIIDLGDRTLVFDAFDHPEAAQELEAAARSLTGQPVSLVLLSHAHEDHWLGMQVFAENALFLATTETRQRMEVEQQDLRELQSTPQALDEDLENLRTQLEVANDPDERLRLELSLRRYTHFQEILPALNPHLPAVTFDQHLLLHGTQRRVEITAPGPAHTSGDCYLALPEEKIIFLGDIGFFQCQPFMPYSDPPGWVTRLQELASARYEIFVPGHGPLGSQDDLRQMRGYIELLLERVRRGRDAGRPFEALLEEPLPEPYATWTRRSTRLEANLRYLYNHLHEFS